MRILIFLSLIFTLNVKAQGKFSCRHGENGPYIGFVDSQGKTHNLAFATAEQCAQESVKLEAAQVDASKLPLQICGCEQSWLMSPMSAQRWALLCYTISRQGTVKRETKFIEFFFTNDGERKCEQARLGLHPS